MILTSGRIVPNWILQSAFELFEKDSDLREVILDLDGILDDEQNETDRGTLSVEDALEIYKKFNSIYSDYEDMLDEFFEKHGLGHDEYDGDDDDDDADDEPDGPEDNAQCVKPVTQAKKEE